MLRGVEVFRAPVDLEVVVLMVFFVDLFVFFVVFWDESFFTNTASGEFSVVEVVEGVVVEVIVVGVLDFS